MAGGRAGMIRWVHRPVRLEEEEPVPSLVRPKSKRKGEATRTSGVFHIRYYCPFRRRLVAISTRCRSRRNAEKRLREFCNLLERGEVGRDNPFLLQRRRAHRGRRPAGHRRVPGGLRERPPGRPGSEGEAQAGVPHPRRPDHGRVRKIVEGCGARRAGDLSTDAVNRLLDRLQQEPGNPDGADAQALRAHGQELQPLAGRDRAARPGPAGPPRRHLRGRLRRRPPPRRVPAGGG